MLNHYDNFTEIEIPLCEEIDRGLQIQPGMYVCRDASYGEKVYCVVLQVLSLPSMVDSSCPDSGIRWSFHVILKALDDSYNKINFNGIMVHAVTSIRDPNLFRCIENNVEDLYIPTVDF